jgi:hypothetical protein
MLNNINVNILKKAFPHLDEQRRKPINIILKLTELNECINEVKSSSGIESCSESTATTINTEALLRDIKPECPKPIRDTIDMILNFSKTKDFYKTYMNMTSITDIVPYTSQNTNTPLETQNPPLENINMPLDDIKNGLSPEQLQRINEFSQIVNNQSTTDTTQ